MGKDRRVGKGMREGMGDRQVVDLAVSGRGAQGNLCMNDKECVQMSEIRTCFLVMHAMRAKI